MEGFCKNHDCVILYCNETGGCEMKNVHVTCSSIYNRKIIPDLDYLIEENWEKFSNELEILYNADKFRLHSVDIISEQQINVKIGLTCYKDYIGTNMSPNIDRFIEYGLKKLNVDKQVCLSDALGVGAIVVTIDDYLVLVKRSQEVAEEKGMTDFPGGHSEPSEMAKKIGVQKIDLEKTADKDVVYEMFHSMIREVRDEINIPETSLKWPLLLGLLRNCTNGGKPHASFLINCDLTKARIQELYNEGGPEAYESTEIFFVKKQDLVTSSADQLKELFGDLSPCGKATLYLYSKAFNQPFAT
eukprot:gene19820-21759_t